MKRTSMLVLVLQAACLAAPSCHIALAEEAGEGTEATKNEESAPQEKTPPKAEPKKKAAQGPRAIGLTGWASEDEKYTNPIEVSVVDAEGGKQLQISYKGGEKDKAAICKDVSKQKLPGKGVLRINVANPNEKAVELTVALKTGSTWAFHESQRVEVKPSGKEFAAIEIDLTASTFKSEKTEWKNTGELADPNDIRSLQLGIYNGKESGSLVISALELVSKP